MEVFLDEALLAGCYETPVLETLKVFRCSAGALKSEFAKTKIGFSLQHLGWLYFQLG